MIKAVLFDFDGVLTTDSSGSYTTCKNIQKSTNIPLLKIIDRYSKYKENLMLGKTRHWDIWDEFCRSIGARLDIGILENAFANTPKNAAMFSLAAKLRTLGIKVGIICDMNLDRVENLEKTMKLSELFDEVVSSCRIGAKKDKPKIFKATLKLLKIKPKEAVFIDNTKSNLVTAKKVGFETFFYKDSESDIRKLVLYLNGLGVLVK